MLKRFFGYKTLTASGAESQAPIFDLRTMDTQVLIPNANTLVMGGLVDDNPTDAGTKVPVLGDIPFLGAAFRSSSKIGGQEKPADFHHADDSSGLGFSSDHDRFPECSTAAKTADLESEQHLGQHPTA